MSETKMKRDKRVVNNELDKDIQEMMDQIDELDDGYEGTEVLKSNLSWPCE